MDMNCAKTNSLGLQLVCLLIFECSAYTLRLRPEYSTLVDSLYQKKHYRESSKERSNNETNMSSSSIWKGWNEPTFQRERDKISGRSSDWTWNLEPETKKLEKTINFQVFDDTLYWNGDINRPPWPHDELTPYDPYSFQQRQYAPRHPIYNHIHPDSPRLSDEYVWKDLRPFFHAQSYPRPHYYGYGYGPYWPHHDGVETNFGSGTSGSSLSTNLAQTLPGHSAISHASGNKIGVPLITGVETNRKYAHDTSGKYYYYAPEYKNRKRYRLEIHPGIIAAPIAGLAAFGVAHAFTSKPVLLELGVVDKKKSISHHIGHIHDHGNYHHHQHGHHHTHHGHHHVQQGHHQVHPIHTPLPEISKPYPLPHSFPHPHPHPLPNPHIHPVSSHSDLSPESIGNSKYPILHPIEKPEPESKPWWSPIAAMIPRLRNDIERD